VLGEETAGEPRGPSHLARHRLEPAAEETGKGGLPVAVGAEQRDAVVGIEPEVDVPQDRLARLVADSISLAAVPSITTKLSEQTFIFRAMIECW